MKKYEKYDCEIILNNYTNTMIRYNKFFEKGCVTTSCKRKRTNSRPYHLWVSISEVNIKIPHFPFVSS